MNTGNNNLGKQIKKNLKDNIWILEYIVVGVAIIYVIGYIYLLGVNAGFINKKDVFNIYNFNRLDIVDKIYFQSGIKYMLNSWPMVIGSGIAIILLILYIEKKIVIINSQQKIKDIKKILRIEIIIGSICLIANSINIKNYIPSLVISLVIGIVAIICIICKKKINCNRVDNIIKEIWAMHDYMLLGFVFLQIYILLSNISSYTSINISSNIIFVLLKIYILIECVLSVHIISEVIKSGETNAINKVKKSIISIILIVAIGIFLGGMIIFDGLRYTLKEIEEYGDKKGELETSVVYLKEENEKIEYVNIDNSGDMFTGYNLNTNRVDMISKDGIEKIEYINRKKPESYEKFTIDNNSDENIEIIKIVQSYYDTVRLGKGIHEWLSLNATEDFYGESFSNISSELLDKRISGEYLNKNDSMNFIGIDTTVPMQQERVKKINNKDIVDSVFEVGVIEVWEKEIRYHFYDLVKVGDEYKISDIRNNINDFKFK